MSRKKPTRKATASGEFRIIAGAFKRRRLRFPAALAIRPTPDRLRETLFNWLMHDVDGARVLDLFAGSGALGLEALSRGAARVDFVEAERTAAAAIAGHIQTLQATDRANVHSMDVRSFALGSAPYDLVFLDPPYASDYYTACLQAITPALSAVHRVYVEHATNRTFNWPDGWQELRSYRCGQAMGRLAEYTAST